MPSIFIYNYNNYYNRKVKKEDSLEKYGSPIYIETGNNVNFNPSDGVNTYYDAGRINNSYDGHGDYLIYSEDNVSITSRWFITEADRLRKGQYRCVLRRDVLVDYYPQVVSSPCYIEKATLLDSDPMIYNNEGVAVNQIKTNEYTLKDNTKCSWLVGYFNRNYKGPTDSSGNVIPMKLSFNADLAPQIIVENTQVFYARYSGDYLKNSTLNVYVQLKIPKGFGMDYHYFRYSLIGDEWVRKEIDKSQMVGDYLLDTEKYYSGINLFESTLKQLNKSALKEALPLYISGYDSQPEYNNKLKVNGKTVKVGTQTYTAKSSIEDKSKY